MIRIRRALLVVLLAGTLSPGAAAQVSGALNAARELYAAARYDEALAVLNRMQPADTATPADRRAVEQYRSLCLLALGRAREAEDAIAAVVNADPMYRPSDAEASPRVRTAFSEVRQRLLPGIALSHYGTAKRLYDDKQYSAAAEEFRYVLRLLDDPDMTRQSGDLRVLASGFVDLSVAAAAPPPQPKKDPPAQSTTPGAVPGRIYTSEDSGVTAPVAIKQDVPRVPASLSTQVRDRGIVEIVIDELGRVTMVSIRTSLHHMYDTLLLSAAREWRYQPARVDGTPVKFRKVIQITLSTR